MLLKKSAVKIDISPSMTAWHTSLPTQSFGMRAVTHPVHARSCKL